MSSSCWAIVALLAGCPELAAESRAGLRGERAAEAREMAADTPDSTEALAKEFRELRTRKGHFSGATWDDAVDTWGGRKHEVMGMLAQRLMAGGASPVTRARVVEHMGEPDQVVKNGDDLFAYARSGARAGERPADDAELLVYHWRGTHDFLWFEVRGDRVVRSDWWMALE